jgi:phosphoribosylaminoimidazolecarboxamide formyltransferase/IMP cyclohydrolase
MLPIQRALISLSDKTGSLELARGLAARGVELLSTGGTLRHLREAGVPVQAVADVTGFPEILDGRVKTLHPRIHAGILADRGNPEHLTTLAEHAIGRIDLVVVNLYPFRETVARPTASAEEIVENIDIGGPSMLRAAAKNFGSVAVVVDPDDYARVLAAIAEGDGVVPLALRRELAGKAFRHTADYDQAVAGWFVATAPPTAVHGDEPAASLATEGPEEVNTRLYPGRLTLELEGVLLPRYGENPHQSAAVYASRGGPGVLGGFRQLQGKELSWNNVLDADAARKLVALFDEPAVVIVKHNNPCGVGRGVDLVSAYERALACDPVSAFGSIVAVNRPVDAAFVAKSADLFIEVLVAPGYDVAARERLAAKKNLRALICPLYRPAGDDIELRAIDGGFLAQQPDASDDDASAWTCPTVRQPTAEERAALVFAWRVSRYVKSNAIVVANRWQTVGVGAGQMSRVDSCRLATGKAQLPLAGTVAASDAFFPFRDGVDLLLESGITAIVQPGGSKRDDEAIAAVDARGATMLFTGIRHFRH